MRYTFLILFLIGICAHYSFAQNKRQSISGEFLDAKTKYIQTDSGLLVIQPYRSGCKAVYEMVSFIPNQAVTLKSKPKTESPKQSETFLTLHGNISYNYNYRSYIDTPFAEKDVMQHSVQTRLNVKLKEKYPFTVFLTSRRSNSPFFSNATDVSFQFRQSDMLEDIKKKMRTDADAVLIDNSILLTPAQIYQREKDGFIQGAGELSKNNIKKQISKYAEAKQDSITQRFKKMYDGYKTKMDKLIALQNWAKHSSRTQDEVEEKEKKLRGNADIVKDSLENEISNIGKHYAAQKLNKADSTIKGSKEIATEKRKEIDSLKKQLVQSEKEIKIFQKKITDSIQQVKKQIAAITDRNGLYEYLEKKGGSTKELSALQRTLLSVKQIGIGRSWIDYSELTVKNISLSGVNVEMNPGNIYLAAAAGKVNYRFRDYIVKGNYARSNQSVGLVRAGFGRKDRNNVILTYYSGKKALLNQRSISDSAAVQPISGFSVETRAALDNNNYLIGEYARSTSPRIKGKIFDLKSNTNEAWSLKLISHYGNTKVTSYYRKTGEGFQSFTLFPTNNKQDAWMFRVNQGLWQNHFIIDAAIRKNDFQSPIAAPVYSNTAVFKSLQLTARIPKYPFVSVGYYPSSQLTLSNNNLLYENRYNTLNGIISHSYFIRKLSMNSNATYTKFYNQGNDTGFIYYNAATFTFNHSVNVKSFIFQGIATVTDQSLLHQTTLEPVVTYVRGNKFSVSGSAKWSRVNHKVSL